MNPKNWFLWLRAKWRAFCCNPVFRGIGRLMIYGLALFAIYMFYVLWAVKHAPTWDEINRAATAQDLSNGHPPTVPQNLTPEFINGNAVLSPEQLLRLQRGQDAQLSDVQRQILAKGGHLYPLEE